MIGLAIYTLSSLGLGAWLPTLNFGGRRSIGAVLFGGYAALLASLFLMQAVLGMGLLSTFWIVFAVAVLGLCRLVLRNSGNAAEFVIHPAIILPVAAGILIALRGHIDYLPYTVDEFTNWLGGAKTIHSNGGYAAIRETIYLPGYTPGWRLALLLPWQIDGAMDLGRSAAAGFVLHAGLVAIMFDIVRWEAAERLQLSSAGAAAGSWIAVLVFLAAQGTGTLWTYTLLIEQPQIYFYAGTGFLLLALRTDTDAPSNTFLYIGLALAGGYLVKSATVALLPAVGLALLWLNLNNWNRARGKGVPELLRNATLALAPALLCVVLWRGTLGDVAGGCMSSPFATLTAAALSDAFARDWADLGARFIAATGGYILGYKTPVLIIACVGLYFTCVQKRSAALIALVSFAAIYLVSLYWYHLSCFGDFYFTRLNSIERFTRVVLQPLHALGLLGFTLAVLSLAQGRIASERRIPPPVRAAIVATVVALGGLQVQQVSRSLEDITTRKYQSVDPRLAEVRAATRFVKNTFPANSPPPLVQFISQGTDKDILGYARYYAFGVSSGRQSVHYRTAPRVSWSYGAPSNIWQAQVSEKALLRELKSADVIWPVRVDPWLESILQSLTSQDALCKNRILDSVLVHHSDGLFRCLQKP